MSSSLIQQGIDAYRAGNRDEAVRLLTQAVQQDPQSEDGWLYLGAALSDRQRQREAFQRVLAINPNNEKAKNAIARLDAAPGGTGRAAGQGASEAASKFGKQAGAAMGAAGAKMNEAFAGKRSMKLPIAVQGAPESLTLPEMIALGRTRIQEGFQVYTKQDFEQIVTAGQSATQWDSVFIAGLGCVAVGAATLVGGEVGWILGGFARNFLGIVSPIFAAIIAMLATGAGFAGAVYGSRAYLQNQNVNVPMPQHSMYYAMVWLPITIVNAVGALIISAIGMSTVLAFLSLCFLPLFAIVALILAIYGWWLLKGAFDRVYGNENNRGLITAAIAIIAGWAARWIVQTVLFGVLGLRSFGNY